METQPTRKNETILALGKDRYDQKTFIVHLLGSIRYRIRLNGGGPKTSFPKFRSSKKPNP